MNTYTTTFECVDIEPGDSFARSHAGDMMIFRRRDGIDYEIHLRWQNLKEYAEWVLRNIKELPDVERLALSQILGVGEDTPQR
jgi:hypothetical protein